MPWHIALSISLFLFVLAPFYRKWVDLVFWPRISDWWASLNQAWLRARIAKLENTLREAERLQPQHPSLEWIMSEYYGWRLTSATYKLTVDRLHDNLVFYLLALLVLNGLWKPLATLTGSTLFGWSIMGNIMLIFFWNILEILVAINGRKRDMITHTDLGRSKLRQRIEALKVKVK